MVKKYRIDNELTTIYFSTCTITEWLYVFTDEKYFQIIIDSLKYCMANKGLYLLGYIIMLNHIHLLTSNADDTTLSNIMRDFKHFTSSRIIELLEKENKRLYLYVFKKAAERRSKKQSYKVWQEEYHPIAITSEKWFRQKLEYMHYNPVRKGYVEKPEDWKYSSARNWLLDDDSVIMINREFLS